jgi:hypothetical protein
MMTIYFHVHVEDAKSLDAAIKSVAEHVTSDQRIAIGLGYSVQVTTTVSHYIDAIIHDLLKRGIRLTLQKM